MTDVRGYVRMIDRGRVLNAAGLVLLVVIIGLFLSVTFPQLAGADHSFVVQSSSMSPSITAGSVVYVNDVPADRITERDVITFQSADTDTRTTHRVVEIVERKGEQLFRTKGDANEEPDPDFVGSEQLIGRVSFHLPLIGYAVTFAGSQYGLVTLVIIPAVLLVVTELRDLFTATTEDDSEDAVDEPVANGGEES